MPASADDLCRSPKEKEVAEEKGVAEEKVVAVEQGVVVERGVAEEKGMVPGWGGSGVWDMVSGIICAPTGGKGAGFHRVSHILYNNPNPMWHQTGFRGAVAAMINNK